MGAAYLLLTGVGIIHRHGHGRVGHLARVVTTQVVPKYVSGWLIAPGAAEPGAGFLFAAITQTSSRLGQFDNNYRRNRCW